MNAIQCIFPKSGIQNLHTSSGPSDPIFFNLDVKPWEPNDCWKVERNQKQGIWKYNPEELCLFSPQKKHGVYPTGEELLKEFRERLANSNFIECLFDNPTLISDFLSEQDRGTELVLLGTTFFDPFLQKRYVRALILPKIVADFHIETAEELIEPAEKRSGPHWVHRQLDEEFGPDCRIVLFKEGIIGENKGWSSFFKKIAALF